MKTAFSTTLALIDFRTSQFFEWSQSEGTYLPGNPHFYSGVYPTTTLIFTPDNQVLTHVTENVGFNIQADPRCESSTPYAGEGWYACDNTAQDALGRPLELRIVRIYSPNRGMLTVTNHSEGDLTYTIPWTNHGPQSGGAGAYGVLPRCEGTDCPNYMGVYGYVFSIPTQAEISLSFEVVLSDEDVLSDLFVLEYSEEQMTPITEITIRSIQGTGLMDRDQSCIISSGHSRALITPFGPVNGAAGAWYRECGHAWPLKHSLQELIDRSYQGEDPPPGGGDGGTPAVIDLEATPPSSSPWSTRAHPDPSRVLSLYSSIPDYQDSLSDADQCRGSSPCAWPTWGAGQDQCTPCDITWIPGWSQQLSFEFEHQLPEGSTQLPSDKILRIETSTHWFTIFEMPPNATLDLTEYDVLHFEIWTPGVTHLSIKMRDFGPNQRWDADVDDVDGIKFFAFDDNLIPLQWSVLEVRLDELFPPNSARNIGYLVIDNLSPNLMGMPIYLSNLYFFSQDLE